MTAAPAQVRVALVGLGWAARTIWLPRLTGHPRYTVVAAVDPDPDPDPAAVDPDPAARLDGVVRLADPDDLRAGDVDLAVVTVPNHLHAPVAAGLLARGIATFVEKPVCLTTGEALRLARAEDTGGAALLAGSAARHRADVRALHGLASTLGPLRHVDVSWVRARGVPDAGGWFTRRHLAGGGALVDLGWHLLDVVAPLLPPGGFAHAVGTVSADHLDRPAARAAWRDADGVAAPAAGDVEDTARAFLVAERHGVSVALRASWASHEPHDVTTLRVEGRDGVASLRTTFGFSPHREPEPVLTVTRHGTTDRVPVAPEPVGAEYDHQLDALPGLLADPAARGRAVAQAHRVVGAIERIYAAAGLAGVPPVPVPSGGNHG